MNPFQLAGGAFLAFYAGLAAFLVIGLWLWLRLTGGESRLKATELTGDPYRIACLRHGEAEAIRIALFNLVDRGLVEFNDEYLVAKRSDAAELVRRPLDRAILAACGQPTLAKQVLRNPRAVAEAVRYRAEITNKGLLHAKAFTWSVIAAGGGLLAGIGIARIVMALMQGRHNVLFLVALMVASCWVLANVLALTPTRAGAEMMSQLRFMTRRLKDRATQLKSGGATNEALLLASVYGLSVLPTDEFAFVTWLFPKPKSSDWSSGGDGDGGGSGCGGGGGCGGCGG